MEQFIPGQRWISNTESELGLGLILETGFKRVTVLFLASDEKRIYAADNAPLTRVIFSVGDVIESQDENKATITDLREKDGLITYICKDESGIEIRIEEIELNHHIQFNKPQDRLFTGQIDPGSWFSLRYETWQRLLEHQISPVKGLLGARVSLIAHQLYIAHESANRLMPRIMLADEVGLGKTIEAGLILHHRLINKLSHRVLIIVPESLLHQWLVEMLRRFNLRFSVFDEARYLEETGETGFDNETESDTFTVNPFLSEQLILCSLSFFARYPERQLQALEAGWDMVIVDEAHHLEWSEHKVSPEYKFVEQLALISPGLILLTATPEQLGKESHFARLRLLDPDRFYSFEAFLEEDRLFEPVATQAKLLLANKPLSPDESEFLAKLLKDDNVQGLLKNLTDPVESENARAALINIILDHHGTGRILFRNSRMTVKGFPERECFGYPLKGQENTVDLTQDPRFVWLVNKVKKLTGQKALLICKHAQTAIDLEQCLKNRIGIASAIFHEGMTIIERDRAAAYFADQESNARLLICSEIGSEGRNFQFVHHLILWDLPTNPDLLQQRIGRLDRIGQKHVIQIHVPFIEDTEQALLFQWYDKGLNVFRHNNSAATSVAEIVHAELLQLLENKNTTLFAEFINKTKLLSAELEIHLNNGRDVLLELNSCRKESSDSLIERIGNYDQQDTIWSYMEDVFECYGVDTELHSRDCYIVRPSDHLRVSHFPMLPEEGLTFTVNRISALAREELQFMTWEHPIVIAAMDMVLSSETGNATISVVKHDALRAGQFLLECLFIVECSAPAELQVSRFLPSSPVRILINQHQQNVTESITHQSLIETGQHFDKGQIVIFLNKQRQAINKLLQTADQAAQLAMQQLIEDACTTMLDSLSMEIKRLVRLKKVNPSIKTEEVEQLKDLTLLAHEHIQQARLRLDAVRFIITS
jgi:ATP-dependent helicase HepA